jgi:hypothetical protein
MRTKLLGAALLAGCVVLLGIRVSSAADDKKPVVPTEKKVEGVKAEKYTPASTIDFGGELGLPFQALTTLGSRIEAARRAPDPVALAAAGEELAAAEKVANKKASLTSDAVLKEAAELAKLRGNSKELMMVAELLKDKDLQAEAEKAAKAENTPQSPPGKEEGTRGARYLRVINHSEEGVDIYVDGRFIGHVHSHRHETFPIHMKHEHVHMMARHHHRTWGPARIHGEYDTYTWELTD